MADRQDEHIANILGEKWGAEYLRRRAESPDVTPKTESGRALLHQKADLLQRDDSRDYSHQVVRLSDVHEIIDEALPEPREPGTYRTPEGGIEVIVGIEESTSYVEDMWPDEVALIRQEAASKAVAEIREDALLLADAVIGGSGYKPHREAAARVRRALVASERKP